MTQTFPARGFQRREKKEEEEDWGDERKMGSRHCVHSSARCLERCEETEGCLLGFGRLTAAM